MSLSLPTTTNLVLILLILYTTLLILDQISQLLKQRHDAANVALTALFRELQTELAEFGTKAKNLTTAVEETETRVEMTARNMFLKRAAALEKIWELMGRGEDFMIEARVVRESAGRHGDNSATTEKADDVD